MERKREDHRLIWARWRVREGGRIEVEATYSDGSDYYRRGTTYRSLEEAAQELGSSFRDVVTRVTSAGSLSGRWQP